MRTNNLWQETPDGRPKMSSFYCGLSGLLGPPVMGTAAEVIQAMKAEHCSMGSWCHQKRTLIYGIVSSYKIEWDFVSNPTSEEYGGRFPAEEPGKLPPNAFDLNLLCPPRKPRPLSDFDEDVRKVNDKLREEGEELFGADELVAVRLFCSVGTQYSMWMRGYGEGYGDPDPERVWAKRFKTTIHTLQRALVKLAKVTDATTVFRGVNALLPKAFTDRSHHGLQGGLEMGFMGSSPEVKVSTQWKEGMIFDEHGVPVPKTLFQFTPSLGRPADIGMFHTHPEIQEFTFPALTFLEAKTKRVVDRNLYVDILAQPCPH